jgi:hypothetical protein
MSDEELQAVREAIKVLQDTLVPKLVALGPQDRRELQKMGDRTAMFVLKTMDHVNRNPSLRPAYLDLAEFAADMAAVDVLQGLQRPLAQITSMVDDSPQGNRLAVAVNRFVSPANWSAAAVFRFAATANWFTAELRQVASPVNWFTVEPHRSTPRGNGLAVAVNRFVSRDLVRGGAPPVRSGAELRAYMRSRASDGTCPITG